MSTPTDPSLNSGAPDERWQANLLALARALPYPATPAARAASAAGHEQPRRGWWAARPAYVYIVAAVLVALLALLAVPSARAALLDFLQIGAVRIFVSPTSTPPTGVAATNATAGAAPTPTAVLSVLDLAGETTLAEARQRAGFDLRLPAYPADLGQPDAVFVQTIDSQSVILVWLEPADRAQVRLSLQFIDSTADFQKTISTSKQNPAGLEFTNVNDEVAVWTTGPYILETRAGAFEQRRLIQGHVLIWSDGRLTYRLETNQSQAEAVRTAESVGK